MRGVVLLGTFVITWFLALFCLLPVGQREDAEPTMKLTTKFLLATVIAAVGWCAFYAMVRLGVVDI
jgi:predicted secreted protein